MNRFISLIIVAMLAIIGIGCNECPVSLPTDLALTEATTIGANTISFKINDGVWIASSASTISPGSLSVSMMHNPGSDTFFMYANNRCHGQLYLTFLLDSARKSSRKLVSGTIAGIFDGNYTLSDSTFHLDFTRFDSVNHIYSGRFTGSFGPTTPDYHLNITEGRFDILGTPPH